MLSFIVGVVSAVAFTAISMAITGDFSLETLGGAVADAIFWGGVFAFVSASVNAVKAGISGIKKSSVIDDPGFTEWLNKGEANYTVYKGISQNGDEVYTGITRQILEKRLYQHNYKGKNFRTLKKLYSGLTKNQARAIETYKILHDGTSSVNKILSISRNHKYFNQAMSWVAKFLRG